MFEELTHRFRRRAQWGRPQAGYTERIRWGQWGNVSHKFSVSQMMSVSGHRTETMFYNYVKLSLDEYADSVASAAVDGLI